MNAGIMGFAIKNGRLQIRVGDYEPNNAYHHPSFFKETTFARHGSSLDSVAFARIPNPQALVFVPDTPTPKPTIPSDWVPVTTPQPGHFVDTAPASGSIEVTSPPRPVTHYIPQTSCDDETLESVADDGSVLTTLEGHRYEVSAGDEVTTSVWTSASDLVVCETSTGLKILNKDENESVEVTRL